MALLSLSGGQGWAQRASWWRRKVGEEAQMAEVRRERAGEIEPGEFHGLHVVVGGVARSERRLGVIDYQLGLLEFHGLQPLVAKERKRRRK
jgi:hypothetical protein